MRQTGFRYEAGWLWIPVWLVMDTRTADNGYKTGWPWIQGWLVKDTRPAGNGYKAGW